MDLIIAFLYIALGLIFLGIVIAFSPTLVLTELAVLTQSKTPLKHTVAYIAGISIPVIIFSLISLAVVNPDITIQVPGTKQILRSIPLTDIFVGLIILIYGIKLKISAPQTKSKFNSLKLLNTKTLFWFGAIKMATSLTSIAAILYAARFLKTNTTESLQQVFGVFWLLCVSIMPFVLIALSKQFSPKSFIKIQAYSDRLTDMNWRLIIALALITGGFILIFTGIYNIDNSVVV